MEKIYKHACSCGWIWYNDNPVEYDCDNVNDDDLDDDARHMITTSTKLYITDYLTLMEMEIEDSNRHSLMDIPEEILLAITSVVESKTLVRKIMKSIYENVRWNR